jgi:hypothetical protein
MRILLAIKTCHRYAARAQAQRETWIPRLAAAVPPGWTVDLRFFLGRPAERPGRLPRAIAADEVWMDCDDSYAGLTEKFRKICRWALAREYDYLFSCDDDVYLVPERLLAGWRAVDYAGRWRGPSGGFPAPYASGFATWLSRAAIEILAEAPSENHRRDDRWIGNVLWMAGIRCDRETRFVVAQSSRNAACASRGARINNPVIAACEFGPEEMHREHQAFITGELARAKDVLLASGGPFSDVAILISTFLRDGFLFQTVRDIEAHLPGAKIVIVDDGHESRAKIQLYCQLARRGHACEWLLFNSSAPDRLAAAAAHLDRPYLLTAADDFDFSGAGVAAGIALMRARLESAPAATAISGRVNGQPHRGFTLLRSTALAYFPWLDSPWCLEANLNTQRDATRQRLNHRDWAKYRAQRQPLFASANLCAEVA